MLDCYTSNLRLTQRVKFWSDWMEPLKGNTSVIVENAGLLHLQLEPEVDPGDQVLVRLDGVPER